MATVYLAHDLKHDRKVALKLLREELSASLGKERFLREIKVAAALQHPHILPLYDSGAADDLLFYVMPYVDGLSLRDKLAKEGELPIGEAVRILRDVADALTEAHRHGVVHRDLKPENVMLRGRHALVMDFGVAKALSEATGRQSLTTVGVALGTPTYMAPEQAVADPHVDHRADIYAFGVVAYELLAARPPFTGASPQQMLAAHVTAVRRAGHGAPDRAAGAGRAGDAVPGEAPGRSLAERRGADPPARGAADAERRDHPDGHAAGRRRGRAATRLVDGSAGARARRPAGPCSASAPGARPTARPARHQRPLPRQSTTKRVGVLPFASRSRDTADAYLGDGMATDLDHHPGRHDRPARRLPQLDLCPAGEDRARGRHRAPRGCDGGGHGRQGGRAGCG